MSFEVFERELSALTAEQQAIVYNLVVSLKNMNENRHEESEMSKEETMKLFNDLSGCIKSETHVDARKEYLEYLDERYGV